MICQYQQTPPERRLAFRDEWPPHSQQDLRSQLHHFSTKYHVPAPKERTKLKKKKKKERRVAAS